jgi:enoyl reductase-like protein
MEYIQIGRHCQFVQLHARLMAHFARAKCAPNLAICAGIGGFGDGMGQKAHAFQRGINGAFAIDNLT